ncbi:hypothetical protein IEQ34_026843 [Dendrobium chrysotoxum]|uniref:SWI/SNF complex subunit SWI3B n=1 Tax=Dendrobium chrysotoxum TaxID=161865 RepID=A0AAV7FL18_DENCH|nr:hypothetical protein IEQ34_026843 [Dendrobium chrysotoxum]
MEAQPPSVQLASSSPSPVPATVNPAQPSQLSQTPAASPVKSEIPARESNESLPAAASCLPDTPPPVSYTITIPSCSGWFSWDQIHETEKRILPEFFDERSSSKNPSVYKYYRDSIIGRFRANPSRKITFTEARRGLVGDVGSVRRVFDFLEAWGLINYTPSVKPLPKDKKEAGDTTERKDSSKRLCSNCKSLCNIVCFVTDKADMTLCARCFVRGNYRAGLNSADFKRVDISEETKTEWTDKETLHLLEAILHYGEDWKKVAEHVGSRSEKDCVARFIKLPFGEQLLGPSEFTENDKVDAEPSGYDIAELNLSKRRRLTPLADASNPIIAQVAFLAAMAGPEVAETASKAAVAALSEFELSSINNGNGGNIGFNNQEIEEANDQTHQVYKDAADKAQSQLNKEQQDIEQSISGIIEVQMKEIQDKLVHFEELELLMEKERLQLKYMKDLLFADQLTILQQKPRLMPQKL